MEPVGRGLVDGHVSAHGALTERPGDGAAAAASVVRSPSLGSGSQYAWIVFGRRRKGAGVRPSTGTVGYCFDNALCEPLLSQWSVSA